MAKSKYQAVGGVYYIVNPAGAVHNCDRDHAQWRLRTAGWRLAADDEIARFLNERVQAVGAPFGEPFEPLPDIEPELPEQK